MGNRFAAREFEIDESMIRYWRKKKPQKPVKNLSRC